MSEGVFAQRQVVARGEAVSQDAVAIEEFRFFEPTDELAKAILDQNQKLVADYVSRNFPPGYESLEHDSPDNSALGRIQSELMGTSSAPNPNQLVVNSKRLISERLFHYLSSLAETPRSVEGGTFPISEFIPSGMATMLGLSAHRELPVESARAIEISQALTQLTSEFRNWLRTEHGSFVTPWIEIHLDDADTLRLIAIEENANDSVFAVAQSAEPSFEIGRNYLGTVLRVVDFGAFVELAPGLDGLLHISDIADRRIKDIREEIKTGDQILVKVVRIVGTKISLSHKAALRDSVFSSARESSVAAQMYSSGKASTE